MGLLLFPKMVLEYLHKHEYLTKCVEMIEKKILVICSYANSLIHFRGDFIAELIHNGFIVYGAAPDMNHDTRKKLTAIGAIPLEYNLQRTGLNPLKDLKSIFQLRDTINKYHIDLVFPYTIKPVIYGSIAANITKTPTISLITGLGFTFSGASRKAKLLQKVTELLYKLSIRKNKLIVFQNMDDHKLFIDRKIIAKDQKVDFVSGSGVNLKRYGFRENKNLSNRIIFILVARLIREKGIHLYIEAAKKLKQEFPKAEFHVIGAPDQSPSAIKLDELQRLNKDGIIVYHGKQKDVSHFLGQSDVFVLPTYYREGIPRSILEALSVGLPIITTNSPGCRETVLTNENGILIEPQNPTDLFNSMRFFIQNPHKIKEMGLASRKYAENRFDVKLINQKLISMIKRVV